MLKLFKRQEFESPYEDSVNNNSEVITEIFSLLLRTVYVDGNLDT